MPRLERPSIGAAHSEIGALRSVSYRVRAAQRAGQLLDELKAEGKLATGSRGRGPGRGKKGIKVPDSLSPKEIAEQHLSDLGVSYDQSSQRKELAGKRLFED